MGISCLMLLVQISSYSISYLNIGLLTGSTKLNMMINYLAMNSALSALHVWSIKTISFGQCYAKSTSVKY